MIVLAFLAYTAFCSWVVVLDGAEVIGRLPSLWLYDWFLSTLTVTEIRFSVGIAWLMSLAMFLLFYIFPNATT